MITNKRSIMVALLFCGFFFNFFICPATNAVAITPPLREIVKHLTQNDDYRFFDELTKQPRKAAGLLIGELHPIKESSIYGIEQKLPEHADADHVMAVIAGLRTITGGIDFCARTVHKFGASETERSRKYWTEFNYGRCLSFFEGWPSNGSQYIAPRDAQRKIIAQWKKWYARLATNYRFTPYRTLHPAAFGW